MKKRKRSRRGWRPQGPKKGQGDDLCCFHPAAEDESSRGWEGSEYEGSESSAEGSELFDSGDLEEAMA